MAQASAIESASREVFCEFVCTGELHIVHDCHGERYERRALRPTEKDTIANFVADQFSAGILEVSSHIIPRNVASNLVEESVDAKSLASNAFLNCSSAQLHGTAGPDCLG
jgi:hypothetical protein